MVRIVIQRTARPETASAEEAGRPYLPAEFAPTRLDERTLPLPDPARYQPRAAAQASPRPRRPLVPRWAKWTALAVLAGLFFRRAVAWAVLAALSAALHLVRRQRAPAAPQVRLALAVDHRRHHHEHSRRAARAAEDRGDLRPALGTENFNFVFTHTVSKNIGPVAVLVLRHVLTRSGTRPRPSTSTRAPPGGSRPPATTSSACSGGRARHPGPAGRLDGAAAASAAAVGA